MLPGLAKPFIITKPAGWDGQVDLKSATITRTIPGTIEDGDLVFMTTMKYYSTGTRLWSWIDGATEVFRDGSEGSNTGITSTFYAGAAYKFVTEEDRGRTFGLANAANGSITQMFNWVFVFNLSKTPTSLQYVNHNWLRINSRPRDNYTLVSPPFSGPSFVVGVGLEATGGAVSSTNHKINTNPNTLPDVGGTRKFNNLSRVGYLNEEFPSGLPFYIPGSGSVTQNQDGRFLSTAILQVL